MKAVAAKGSVFLFLLYILWYKEAYGDFSPALYGGAALIVITTLLYVDHKPLKAVMPPKGIIWSIGFGIYSLITGLVVASNRELLASSIETYMSLLLVCWCICIICNGENDIQWLLKCITIVCYACAVYTLLFGKPYWNGIYVTTMGPENNPNRLGILMVFGMFSVLYNKRTRVGELALTLVTVLLFFYVIILSGSRKALLSGGLLCLVWLISFVKDTQNLSNRKEKIIKYGLVVAVLAIGSIYFLKNYVNTASFERLQKLIAGGASSNRTEMYKEAVKFFKISKLFGVGFNQFRVLSSFKTYSHSTYAEVLADGGVFGCILYFYPIIKAGITLIKTLKISPSYQIGMLFALYAVEMFLGTGVIFMYGFEHLLIWSILYMTVEKEYLCKATDDRRGEKICQNFAPSSGF